MCGGDSSMAVKYDRCVLGEQRFAGSKHATRVWPVSL